MHIPDDDYEFVSLTVSQARSTSDGDEGFIGQIIEAIDQAQAPVFEGSVQRRYVLIEIKPD